MRDRPTSNGVLDLELPGLGPCTRSGDSKTMGDETRTFPINFVFDGDEEQARRFGRYSNLARL